MPSHWTLSGSVGCSGVASVELNVSGRARRQRDRRLAGNLFGRCEDRFAVREPHGFTQETVNEVLRRPFRIFIPKKR